MSGCLPLERRLPPAGKKYLTRELFTAKLCNAKHSTGPGVAIMRLEQALADLQCIHAHLDRAQQATCYRSASIGGSGLAALLAGAAQAWWLPVATNEPIDFFVYWSVVATGCVLLIGGEIGVRYLFHSTARLRQQTRESLAEFFPFVALGALLGLALAQNAPEHICMLPSVWATLFGLGVLTSRHRLPQGAVWIAGYYGLASLACIQWGTGSNALNPWTVGLTFGLGQLMTAGILYFSSEGQRAQEING